MSMNRNMGGRDRRALFDSIGRLSFALDELRLYLDVHPEDAEALSLFRDYMEKRHAEVARYTEICGPINAYYVDTDHGWRWIDEPMPWEREG